MAHSDLSRQIVDELLTEHETSTPPQPLDSCMARKLTVTWGLYCHVYRLARSATMLVDQGMDQECLVLIRVMLEHTIMLHWVVERGDDGVDAVHANHVKQMRKTISTAKGTAMEVPETIAGEITDSFDGVDAEKAASNFSKICEDVGCGHLYWIYRVLSQSVHPSLLTSNAYIEGESGALLLMPHLSYPAGVEMIARFLIWAQRDLDRLVPELDRAQRLEGLASAINALPVLPGYQSQEKTPPSGPMSSGTSGPGPSASN